MAMIDSEHDLVVVRIVYDGSPGAGKTASLYALQKSLKTPQAVFSPESENQHTNSFDWLDYTGGLFENRPIHCQILSTPGDPRLQAKREYLLENADAVVFVLDSRPDAIALGLEYFSRLHALLEKMDEPRPQVLIQANYQDDPNALSENDLQQIFAEHFRIYGSIASTGESVRETFVFAVRLALERVSLLQKNQALPTQALDIKSGEALFEMFQARNWEVSDQGLVLHRIIDPDTPSILPETAAVDAVPTDVQGEKATVDACRRHLPDADTSLLWLSPPLATQAILQEINADEMHFCTQEGDENLWIAEHASSQWRYFSRADWHYSDENAARNVLHQQMQWHLELLYLLPEDRHMALAKCEDGQFHLWQIVKTPHTTLSNYLDTLMQAGDAQQFADQLLSCAEKFMDLVEQLLEFVSLKNITLDTVYFDGKLAYVGLLDMAIGQEDVEEDVLFMHVMKNFSQPISNAMESRLDIRSVLLRLNEHEAEYPQLAENLSTLFIQ